MKEERQEYIPAGVAPRPVVLLDVDGTLISDRDQLNVGLLNALQEHGIADVYLFTSMSLNDILYEKANKDSGANYSSRPWLINELRRRGFMVHGVITPADPRYGKGLGMAYEELFLPQHVMAFGTEEAKLRLGQVLTFDEAAAKFSEARSKNLDRPEGETEKSDMYRYFLNNMPHWVGSVIFIDDSDEQIKGVRIANPESMALTTIHTTNKKAFNPDEELRSEYFNQVQPRASALLSPFHYEELVRFDRMIHDFSLVLPVELGEYLTRKIIENRLPLESYQKEDQKPDPKKSAISRLSIEIGAHRKQIIERQAFNQDAWNEGLRPAIEALIAILKSDNPKANSIFSRENPIVKNLNAFLKEHDAEFSAQIRPV